MADAAWRIEVVKRSAQATGFEIIPRRWVVERTIAWINRCRRLAKDYENLNRTAIAFIRLASIRLMLRRFTRYCFPSLTFRTDSKILIFRCSGVLSKLELHRSLRLRLTDDGSVNRVCAIVSATPSPGRGDSRYDAHHVRMRDQNRRATRPYPSPTASQGASTPAASAPIPHRTT